MKRFKKVTSILLSVLFVMGLLAGCGNSSKNSNNKDTNTSEETTQEVTSDATTEEVAEIAIILKTLSNPFWVSMKEGIETEAKAKGVKVDIFAVDSEDDIQGQLQLFENLLSKEYKAIGFAPLSPVNLVAPAAQAYQKGIYLVNIDEKVDMEQLTNAEGNIIAFVTTDNVKIGEKAGNFIIEQIGADGGQVSIIEGKAGNASGEARKEGAENAFNTADNIELVASQPADWDRAKALDVAANMIQRYPELKAIYCANDTMALGALQAVQNGGKEDQIIVVGTDGAPEAIEAVGAGDLAATIGQDSAQVGATSLDLLIAAIESGKNVSIDEEPEFVAVDSKLIK